MISTPRCCVLFTLVVLAPESVARAQSWRLVWQDEFDGAALDATKWSHQTGGGGWGNKELENYTDRTANSFLRDGKLVIQARSESFGGRAYTSARLRTLGKGDWKYGRVEVRAKLPSGRGIWPAIWMMPSDSAYGGWAASGEIDIMELLGQEPTKVYGTIHYGGVAPANKSSGANFTLPSGGDFSKGFHVFALEWEEREIRWYVDGRLYSTKTNWFTTAAPFPAPFDKRFHVLLNVAVGGNWPGSPDASTVFPQEMEVDYVRIYEAASPAANGGQIPGDGNQDGSFDVADAVWTLLSLFGQHPIASLPCGGLSLSAGGNRELLDVNGDGKVDLSDVVYTLTRLFLNGPPPVLGASCIAVSGCPDRCTR